MGNDVVVETQRSADGDTVEVHVLARGKWSRVAESTSFGIGFEVPRSSAQEAESVAVRDAIAEVLRRGDPGLPVPDAIPLHESDTTALPAQLELLRGSRGTLVGVSLILLGLLSMNSAGVLAGVGALFGLLTLVSGLADLPIGDLGAYGHCLPPLAFLLCAMMLFRSDAFGRGERAVAVISFLGALALRLGLGAWGPLHINGQGPHWVNGAARDPTVIAAYGPGYPEIFGPLTAWAASYPDWSIFAANACISAALPALTFLIARRAGLAARVAGAAALILAIDPVAIRVAATESYFPVIILACAAGSLALLLAVHDRARGRRAAAGAGLIVAGLLLAVAVRTHPAAWVAAATVPLTLLAASSTAWRCRCRMLVAAAGVIGGVWIASSGGVLLDVLANVRGGTLMRPPSPPLWGPLGWATAVAFLLGSLSRAYGLAICAGASIAALLMTHHVYAQSWLWQQSYERLHVTMPVLAVASVLPASWLGRRWHAGGGLLILAAIWWVSGLPIVTAHSTEHLEYRWLRPQLATVPPHCRIIYQATAGKRGIFLPSYIGPAERQWVAVDERLPYSFEAALAATDCLYYVRTSLCASVEGRPRCARLESRLQLTPLARRELPARPSYDGLPYDADPVEVMIATALPSP